MYVCVKRKHVSDLNMSITKSKFEGIFIFYFCAGVQFWHFCELKTRLLNIPSFIMQKHNKLFRIWIVVEIWNILKALFSLGD